MVRWLLAVFTLHFLLSLGASASAAVALLPLPAAAAQALTSGPAPHPADCRAAPADGTSGMKQALADPAASPDSVSADLPDDQSLQRPGSATSTVSFPCPQQASLAPCSALARRYLRPPRA
ncbi:hypothetical protein [Melaminivora sp.]|uniref:hypothetical protein n=1 Tax=Melaminivora sp. TaxID=1933032 RepID=UPI0028AC0153|nr:hypothetical protein [Melaminivora sp.]